MAMIAGALIIVLPLHLKFKSLMLYIPGLTQFEEKAREILSSSGLAKKSDSSIETPGKSTFLIFWYHTVHFNES